MDKSRQQFEEYMRARFPDVNGFTNYVADLVWKASRESLEVELPKKYLGEYTRNKTINECKDILISNGVKIKNE
nr:hypothetical protein [Providencia rettgeri]ELR5197659.1 hypothetical protein [Providencia rettgeri]